MPYYVENFKRLPYHVKNFKSLEPGPLIGDFCFHLWKIVIHVSGLNKSTQALHKGFADTFFLNMHIEKPHQLSRQ